MFDNVKLTTNGIYNNHNITYYNLHIINLKIVILHYIILVVIQILKFILKYISFITHISTYYNNNHYNLTVTNELCFLRLNTNYHEYW